MVMEKDSRLVLVQAERNLSRWTLKIWTLPQGARLVEGDCVREQQNVGLFSLEAGSMTCLPYKTMYDIELSIRS